MAYTKKTLANLRQNLADKISAGVVPTTSATLAYWDRMLNEGQQYCADKLLLTKSASYTTAGATSTTPATIVLADDYVLVNKVTDADGNPVSQITKEDSATATSGSNVFWITGNHLDDFYLNTPTNGTYTVYYTFRPAEMSNTTDECIIADPVAVVCYAYSKLRMAQTDPLEDADKEMGECNRRIDEMVSARVFNESGGISFKLQPNA